MITASVNWNVKTNWYQLFRPMAVPASLLQDTWFSIGKVEAGKKLGYHMHQTHGDVYIFLIEGEIVVDGTVLKRRDGMGVYETNSFEIETLKDSHILLIEVPM